MVSQLSDPVYLNDEEARAALDTASNMIEPLLEEGHFGRQSGVHVVVLGEDGFILAEATFGELDDRHNYKKLAYRKAKMAGRERCDTREILAMHPQLVRKGDTHYAGGVYLRGFSVGASGLEDYDDHMVSTIVGAIVEARSASWLARAESDFIEDY